MATTLSPSESYSITMRLEIQNKVGMLGKVTTAIGTAGGDIGAIDLSGHGKGTVIRDVTARARGIDHAQEIINTHPKEAADYKAGKTKVMGFFVGQLMKKTKGQANPQLANEIFQRLLG